MDRDLHNGGTFLWFDKLIHLISEPQPQMSPASG